MSTEQPAPTAGPPGEAAAEPHLLLRAEDGATFLLPARVVEAHRLADEERAALEAQLKDGGADVAGFYYGPSGDVGRFAPERGGLTGYWLPLYVRTNLNREDPNGYHPLVR